VAAKAVLECQPSFTIRGVSLANEREPAVFRPVCTENLIRIE
jgi:hypothetical protein